MFHNEDDVKLLKDIIDCCVRIIKHTNGVDYLNFEVDLDKIAIVERLLEIIGQAAKKICSETHATLNHIPWPKMISLRNKLAHEYGDILVSWLWYIAKNSIPELLNELNNIDELKDYVIESKKRFQA